MTEAGRRYLTALGLIPVVAIVVLGLPPIVFQAALVLVVAAAAWEWSRLAGLFPAPVFAAAAAGSLAAAVAAGGAFTEGLAWVGAAWWLAAFVLVVRYRAGSAASSTDRAAPPGSGFTRAGSAASSTGRATPPGSGFTRAGSAASSTDRAAPSGSGFTRAGSALTGWLVLTPAGAALAAVHARPGGAALAMTLLAVVWAADSGAWFCGRRFGRTRLAPRVSPGKTWEGAAGGLAAGTAVGAAAWWLVLPAPGLLLASVLAAGASVVGDLYESVCKRRAGVKDSGRLLPGHGGLLDRIDGLTAAAPVYAIATAG